MNGGDYDDKTIGIWLSDKKSQKFNWNELSNSCKSHGFRLNKIDIERPLENQGPFQVFLHKLTDIIAASYQGDDKATVIIGHIEQFLSNHPNIIVIDPLDKVRILLNRNRYYTIFQDETSLQRQGIFTPTFAEFTSNNVECNMNIMRQRGIRFPVICKPSVAHGSKTAHDMVLIFNERHLKLCKPPCVVQSFVNHDAVLHKVFVVGNRYFICERPSLKNFYACDDQEPIYYSTGEVCKADSQSTLSILDPQDKSERTMTLNEDKIKTVIRVLRRKIGLTLFGVDVVIDNETGHHAIIDINVFPGYDNFPNFYDHLLDYINESVSRTQCDYDNDSGGAICDSEYLSSKYVNGFINVASSQYDKLNIIGTKID